MMLFTFIIRSCSVGKFSELVKIAKSNANKRSVMSLSEEDVFPGDYKGSCYSYHVSKRLTGSASRNIAGYAIKDSYVAILPSNIRALKSVEETETVFINSESNKMLSLEYIETEEGVRIFSAKEVEPLQVVSNIKFSTHPLWGQSYAFGKNVSLNWEEGLDPFVDGKPKYVVSLDNTIGFNAGFYGRATIDIDAEITGVKSMSLKGKLNMKCVLGAGIAIDKPSIKKDLIELWSKEFAIPNKLSFTILSFKFGVSTDFIIGISVEDIIISLELKLDAYKGYMFEFEKEIGVSSEIGFINPAHRFEVKEYSSGESLNEVIEKIKNLDITLDFSPKLTLTLRVALTCGEKEYCPIYFDVIFNVPITIGWNPSMCPFPPLYAGISLTTFFQFRCDGLQLFNFQIIEKFAKKWRIFATKQYFNCMINAKNVAESTQEGTFAMEKETYVVTSKYSKSGTLGSNPGIAISQYLKENDRTVKGTYMYGNNDIVLDAWYDTDSSIIAVDIDSYNYKIVIEGYDHNTFTGSYYNGEVALEDIIEKNKMIEINEDDTFSKGKILKMNLIGRKSVRVDISKEFDMIDGLKYVCFYGGNDTTATYRLIYKKSNEEYVTAVTNEFFSECVSGNTDKYQGKYENTRVGVIIPKYSYKGRDSEEVNIIFKYCKE